jgi:hypothetical protein
MNFFTILLKKRNLNHHNGKALWKYNLNQEELNDLKNTLQFTSEINIDPRDVTLYFAQWWQKQYNGGIPSKQEVFESLEGNIPLLFDENQFYKMARKGANILGITWIKKQNTLYFKTLLLQGGLPLKHISENHGNYKSFLEAVLEEQPETIEDFIFKSHITDLLPKSSQNEIIYENCLEIVKSILNDDGRYDELLDSEETLKEITSYLKIKKATLKRKTRQTKPKNYWLLSFNDKDVCKINLRLGLADKYTKEALSDILGFDAVNRIYQFYLNDNLICIFRKMNNGSFKTDWYSQVNKEWSISEGLPYVYVMVDNHKVEVKDFIQTIPSIDKPSLWSRFNDTEWRLIKGNNVSNKEAAILFPSNWNNEESSTQLNLLNECVNWLLFEGEVIMESEEGEKSNFLSGVSSFDWTIQSNKPKWIQKSNLPVVKGIPRVFVYDDDGYNINNTRFKVYTRKHNSKHNWEDISDLKFLSVGCYDLKIEKGDLIAHDHYFNIGQLQANYKNQTINSAEIEFENPDGFDLKLYESNIIQISNELNSFDLHLDTEYLKIPTYVTASIGYSERKKLLLDLVSPFQGMGIVNENGQIINEGQSLSMANIYGMRILSTPNSETLLKIKNSLQPDVIITKEIKESTQQLISFKDEIVRLFYLADAMDFSNTVTLELSEGRNKIIYKISGFSHFLDISDQLENKVCLKNSNDNLELFAITLGKATENIEVIPLLKNDSAYLIPETNISNQFIIISSKNEKYKLMPRFVSTVKFDSEIDKMDRIDNYHLELSKTSFTDNIWKQLLKYFNICLQYDIPFSTFDQLRAISRSSEVAARAFLFLGINQLDSDEYIQKAIPEIEKDLGFCFHWINKNDWGKAIYEACEPFEIKYHGTISALISSYLGENELPGLFKHISGLNIQSEFITQRNILDLRSQLGERVLSELPSRSPVISSNYGVKINDHKIVRLLFQSPVAVAESINDIQNGKTIWGGDEQRKVIRRNIQYSQYLCSLYPKTDFYNKTILHVLKRS